LGWAYRCRWGWGVTHGVNVTTVGAHGHFVKLKARISQGGRFRAPGASTGRGGQRRLALGYRAGGLGRFDPADPHSIRFTPDGAGRRGLNGNRLINLHVAASHGAVITNHRASARADLVPG